MRNYRGSMILRVLSGALVAAAVVSVGWQLQAQRQQASEMESGPGKEWPRVGGALNNAHYSPLAQISKANVNGLAGAWMSQIFEEGATSRSTPVIADGLMFITAGIRVYALNAKTGEVVWKTTADPRAGARESLIGTTGGREAPRSGLGLPNWHGVSVGDGKVFVGLRNGHVMALRQKTGEVVWDRQIGEDPPLKMYGQAVSESTSYHQGMVFSGMVGSFGIRSRIVALDANTGKELWRFFPVPGPGETGHDTWPQDTDVWKWGGGGVWQEAAIDPDLGLIYYTTGNPLPEFGGEPRAGDNLFTSSIVALDIKTGKLRWHYQFVHHDIWVTDIGTNSILYDTAGPGAGRKGIGVLRSDGYLFFLDRATGKPLLPVEERAVPQDAIQKTAPTQPFPIGGESILPPCSFWKDKIPAGFILGCEYIPRRVSVPNLLAQGPNVKVTPMSYSPNTGYFYAQAVGSLSWHRRSEDAYFAVPEARVPGLTQVGILAAVDSRTGKIAWKQEMSPTLLGRGGTLNTAGGLVFRLGGDGTFHAYDEQTGDGLWEFQTGFPGGNGTPAAYAIDGEEYVAVPVGPAVWAFKLGGSVRPRQAVALSPPDRDLFTGPITETWQIETTSLEQDVNATGQKYYINDNAFNPYRARVRTGTRVTWVNNSAVAHTIQEINGAWTTGRVNPGALGFASFPKPGRYTYICKDHPWAYGQIIVQEAQAQTGVYTTEQARRGSAAYAQSCSTCHGGNLAGRDPAPALVGPGFMTRWGGRNIGDLFDKVRTTMPPANPGALSDQTHLDIVSFMLQANDLPSGNTELASDSSALKTRANAR